MSGNRAGAGLSENVKIIAGAGDNAAVGCSEYPEVESAADKDGECRRYGRAG